MTSSRLVWTALACVMLCSFSMSQQFQPCESLQNSSVAKTSPIYTAGNRQQRFSTLPAAAQTRISAAIGRDQTEYDAKQEAGSVRFVSEHGSLSTKLTKNGVNFETGSHRWGMQLLGYGYGNNLRPVSEAPPQVDVNRVEYRRAELTEWYVNGPAGVEQGFTLARRPGKSRGRPLAVSLALTGNLALFVDADAHGLTLKQDATEILRYGRLAVNDARGRELPARIEVAGNTLSIKIADSNAVFPIVIDPYVEAAKLTSFDSQDGDVFGSAVAISADGSTLVVSAPQFSYPKGTAYIFVKPSSGWQTTSGFDAELVSDTGNGYFSGVAVSDDGSVIVAGGLQFVRIFLRPSGGWKSSAPIANYVSLYPSTELIAPTLAISSVAISGDGKTVVVGDVGLNAAFVFVIPSGGWTNTGSLGLLLESAKLTASDGGGGNLGTQVGIASDGCTVVVGSDLGAYVYQSPSTGSGWGNGTTLSQNAKLTVSKPGTIIGSSTGPFFESVAISADGKTIAAIDRLSTNAAFVFIKSGNDWVDSTEAAKLVPSDFTTGFAPQFLFSVSVSSDGSTVAATAALDSFTDSPTPGRAVYIFTEPSGGWASAAYPSDASLKLVDPNANIQDTAFADSMTMSPDSGTIVVGSRFLAGKGAAYVFTGSPTNPVASLGATSLSFGNQAVGTTSASQQVTLTNSGTAALHVTSVSAGTGFTTTTNCVTQSPIAAGGSCTEDVAFAPGSVASFTANLTFTDDSGGTPGTTQTVSLSGTGVQASSSVSLTAGTALTGFPVTVNYVVSPQSGDTLTPSGSITLSDGGQSCTKSAPTGSCSFTFWTSGMTTVAGNYAGDTNFTGSSNSVTLSVTVTPAGITNVISEELTLGCIDNSGIANALNAKLAAAQSDIAAGQTQQAINTLKALLNQLQAQLGKHIKSTCTDSSGNTIDLIGLVKTLLASLGVNVAADPITGNVMNAAGAGLSGLTVNILNSKNATVATAATDITGFYYFPATNALTSGAAYTVKVTVPKGYRGSTPGSQSFTWKTVGLSLNNFVVN